MVSGLTERLSAADRRLLTQYPGQRGGRQPVHTVYVPADQVTRELSTDWGTRALTALTEHAPDAEQLAQATGIDLDAVRASYPRVLSKLRAEPIEDLRVDLEDGYGNRDEATEDADACGAARAVAASLAAGTCPPYVGLRMKGMEAGGRARGVRSLALFLETLLSEHAGLPEGLVLTLPKITSLEQVEAMVWTTEQLEAQLDLPAGRLTFELQIETPQSVLGPDGTATVSRMVQAGAGRVSALHYGTYDYSAACGVTAAFQSMAHPVADHAKAVMQLAAAGTGVWLSDGSTNVLPVGTPAQVHEGWRLHAQLVRRSLERAYYQGWDLHPAQLPTRYLATYVFYREAFGPAAERLRAYVTDSGGSVLDEPATAQALAVALVRGMDCGALDATEVADAVGAPVPELRELASRRVG
ncbi:DUF6986 family protein [Lipingzhangella rawalii]|uniref:DUF6986 family protein n=1 Tax=Lipingzhangella rawalii TaxID=2055835 RepID=UPI0038995AD0